MEKPGYYAVIPANVRYDNSLSSSQKLLYGEISALSQKEGYCWASSKYFEELYGVGRITIYKWIKKLSDRGYITTELMGNNGMEGRKIYLSGAVQKSQRGPVQKSQRGPVQKSERKQDKTNKTRENITFPDGNDVSQFNSDEKSSAQYKVDQLLRWEKILSVWKSSEGTPILSGAFKKFCLLEVEQQEQMVEYLETLNGFKKKLLSKFWISTYLKVGLFKPETIKKDLERIYKANKDKFDSDSATTNENFNSKF